MSVQIITGDCVEVMKAMPAESVQTIITSIPYYAQRSYLPADHPHKALELGLESTPEEFVAAMVGVFRVAKHVLRRDGTCWLNVGDTSASGGRGGGGSYQHEREAWAEKSEVTGWRSPPDGLKRKDVIGIPWMLALALRAGFAACSTCHVERRADLWPIHNGHRICIDCALAGRLDSKIKRTEAGWHLRAEIIWDKPNAFPESVYDRPTRSHEQIFLLSKSGRDCIWRARDTGEWSTTPDRSQLVPNPSSVAEVREKKPMVGRWQGFDYYYDADAIAEASSPNTHARAARGRSDDHKWADGGPGDQTIAKVSPSAGRVAKSVAAADRSVGRVRSNADFHRHNQLILPKRNKRSVWHVHTAQYEGSHFATFPPTLIEPCVLAGAPRGGVVLDPFAGSGTVGQVADRHGRAAILIDLDERNVAMMEERLAGNQRTLPMTG